jgi:hypothetical protein
MPRNESHRTLPRHWSDDSLSKFLENAFSNSLATFVRKPTEFQRLSRLDQAFFRIADNLNETRAVVASLLLMSSHSAFRSACGLAMSGSSTGTFPSLRQCLESSLYALHINQNQILGELWIHRYENDNSLKLVRKKFSYGKIKSTLKNNDQQLYTIISNLYERTIDFGGHPNERSITSSMTMTHDGQRTDFGLKYLNDDPLSLDHNMKSTAQVGLGSLCVFQHIFPERFQLLGIDTEIDQLRQSI